MARPSKIDKLPPALKNLIGELRQQGATIDDIMLKLKELKPDIDISRTGLGVHIQDLDKMVENIQHSRAVADALVARFGEETDTRISRASIEILQSAIMKLMVAADGSGLGAEELLQLSVAVKSLSAATKSDVETRAKIRREMAERAAKVAETAAKAAGLSKETIATIRQQILGTAAA